MSGIESLVPLEEIDPDLGQRGPGRKNGVDRGGVSDQKHQLGRVLFGRLKSEPRNLGQFTDQPSPEGGAVL